MAFLLWLPIYIHGHHDLQLQFYRFLIGESHAPAGPAWFLLCLFWVRLCAYGVTKLSPFFKVIVFLASCSLTYYFPYRLFWCIDSTFMAFPLFMVGLFTKQRITPFIKNINLRQWHYLCTFAALFLVLLFCSFIQGNTDINYRIMGATPILYFPCALIGVFMVVTGCKLVKESNALIDVFASGSIIIMALHGIFVSYVSFPLNYMLPESVTEHWFYPVVLCMIVMLVMYYPILFIKKYFSKFIGGR